MYGHPMPGLADSLKNRVDALLPIESPRRKVTQVVSVVLIFEGISVMVLFSYFGVLLGAISLVMGIVILLLLHREDSYDVDSEEPIGLRFLPRIISILGGQYVVTCLGVLIIVLVVAFNSYVSSRPDYGDVDTLTLLMGCMLITYPFAWRRARVETSFAVIFVGLVFILLAAPQVVTSLEGGTNSSIVTNWYVTYMLAIPFAETLDLLGIPSSYSGNVVTIQFQDGGIHSLSISTYCAGLYSFSIFLSAFLSFVLVFERIPNRSLLIVASLGIVAAYFGNLLRMILIGVIGYYEGIDALLWAHKNLGWMVFLSWSSVFWYLIFRYVVRPSSARVENTRE